MQQVLSMFGKIKCHRAGDITTAINEKAHNLIPDDAGLHAVEECVSGSFLPHGPV